MKALSQDLRMRVLAAIAGGLLCRQAAVRFGVSAASSIRWQARERLQGNARPKALGGDRRSGRIEAQAAVILGLIQGIPDITLTEIRTELATRGDERWHGDALALLRPSQDHSRRKITLNKEGACL